MLLINPYRFAAPRFISNDADVVAYVLAVEAADGQQLESGVISAYDSFITGCKSDGIWTAIKASCILAGARTLDGALVSLVGAAPTNNNFVSGDYDRKTGILGNGTTKYINSNRNANSDPQNDSHISVYVSGLSSASRMYLGSDTANYISVNFANNVVARNRNGSTTVVDGAKAIGLAATSRNNNTNFELRNGGATVVGTVTSQTPGPNPYIIFRRGSETNFVGDARLSFYSIGESLDLADLDSRVSTLMTDLAAAI